MVGHWIVYFIELTVTCEDSVEEVYERKAWRHRFEGIAEQQGWKVRICPVEVGCRCFVARSTVSLFGQLGVWGRTLRRAVK